MLVLADITFSFFFELLHNNNNFLLAQSTFDQNFLSWKQWLAFKSINFRLYAVHIAQFSGLFSNNFGCCHKLILKLKNIHPLKWLWFFLEQRNFTPTTPGNLFTIWRLAAIMSDAKRFPKRNANLCRMVDFFGILVDFDNLGLFPLNDFSLFIHSSFSFTCAWILASNLLLNSELTSIKNKYLKIKWLFLEILFSHIKLRRDKNL